MADIETIPEPLLPLERLGSGRAAEVFTWSPGVVVKLARDPQFANGLRLEAAGLAAAAGAGVSVPKPLGFVEHEGRTGLLMERIDGDDLLSAMEKRPWQVWKLSSLTGRLHAELAKTVAPEGAHDVYEEALRMVREGEHVPDAARERLLTILAAVAPGDRLCHRDFHPGNVMLTPDGPVVIDFPNVARGPAVADHANTWVLLAAGSAPPDTPVFGRILIKLFRKVALAAYMRAYRSEVPYEADELRRWKAISVAARLQQGIPEDRETLLRMLSRTLREAGV